VQLPVDFSRVDRNLVAVATAWPTLPEGIRQAIIKLTDESRPTDQIASPDYRSGPDQSSGRKRHRLKWNSLYRGFCVFAFAPVLAGEVCMVYSWIEEIQSKDTSSD
jgi:hypothetical protein